MEIKVAFSASDSFFTQIHCCYCWNVRFVFLLFVSSHRRRNCYICQDAIVMHNGVIYVNIMFSIINSPTNWHAQSNNETVQTSEPKTNERKANRKNTHSEPNARRWKYTHARKMWILKVFHRIVYNPKSEYKWFLHGFVSCALYVLGWSAQCSSYLTCCSRYVFVYFTF